MCGIAGMISMDGRPLDPTPVRPMIDLLRHRGPDEVGFYCDARAALGHARLSIIDLAGGKQPMHNEDGTLWITFNGEIFNYLELREDLERAGHRFATQSDTEVILHAYEEKGERCVHDFNGQWALAIWDEKRRELFVSRDRLGIRPLYYTTVAGRFVFASEIKALFAAPGVSRHLDFKGLDQIFTFWHTLAPRTIFEDICELPPGHCLRLRAGEVKTWRYWRPEYRPDESMDERRCAERLLELLVDATRLRLRADVPVGAYLSGGLDSSVTTALIRRFTDTPLKSFSVTFDQAEFDESAFQDDLVRHLGTEHQAVRCSCGEIGRIFPDVIWHTEKPVLRTAPAPLYLLSGLVRDNGYKVVLTGEGSDEVLGGYDIFKEAKIRRFWGEEPDSRLRPLLLKKLYPYMRNLQNQPPAYLKAFFRVRSEDLADPLFSHLPRWELTARIKTMFSDALRDELDGYDACEELREQLPREYFTWPEFCRAQYLETVYLLPGYILSSQGDRMAMGHSVEGRFPFLDYRVVELAGTIPPRFKMKGLNEKYILKQAVGGLVPDSIRRRPKQPYRAPDSASFLGYGPSAERPDYVNDLLSETHLRRTALFDPEAVRALVEKADDGRAIGVKDNMAIVGILSTLLLVEQFVQGYGREPHRAGAFRM